MKTRKQLEAKLKKVKKILDKDRGNIKITKWSAHVSGLYLGQERLLKWILKSYSK